jgi:hypothetical protein
LAVLANEGSDGNVSTIRSVRESGRADPPASRDDAMDGQIGTEVRRDHRQMETGIDFHVDHTFLGIR